MPARLLKGPFTVDDYYRMAEVGILHEDDRVELIEGQVVVMSPIGARHAGCVDALTHLFTKVPGLHTIVRVQNPIRLGPGAEPQPDLALLEPRRDGYRTRHPSPTDVLLVIEVADTSLAYDREVKLPLYAAAGIAEAWLVDLTGDRIEIRRGPGPDGYREVRLATRGETITPINLPGVDINVDDVLG
jgi:Uma2 family endonuclease